MPRSISDELRLNHRSLMKVHEKFVDIASEMQIWTFYETKDSQLSGLGVSDFDEVHFSAPLASIKSSLVGSRHEQAFSLESEHANCASFGPENTQIMESFLEDLSQAVQKAHKLSTAYVHTPLKLAEHVKLELIGFYDDPDPETTADVRLYVSKHPLNEFLEKGPEECLRLRLNTVAAKPRRGSTIAASHSRPPSSGGLGNLGAGALGIWSNVRDFGQRIVSGGSPRGDSTPNSPEHTVAPQIQLQRPSMNDLRGAASEPTMPRRPRGLTVPALETPAFDRPRSRSSSPRARSNSDEIARTLSPPVGTEISPHSTEVSAPVEPRAVRDAVPGIDEHKTGPTSTTRKDRTTTASALQDPTAGFSRPDPTKRKFMWIHLPYTNPHWVKVCFPYNSVP